MEKVIDISSAIWTLLYATIYIHYYDIYKISIISSIESKLPKFDTLNRYTKIGLMSSMCHAIISLFLSLYLFFMVASEHIPNSIVYTFAVSVSLTHYFLDIFMVSFLKFEPIFIIHHLMSIVMISSFYVYRYECPHLYPFTMILAEITNPLQLVFSYLKHAKQTKTDLFYIVSTLFTYLFCFIRILIIPYIFMNTYHNVHNVAGLNTGNYAQIVFISAIIGVVGSVLWGVQLLMGYYKKVYLPLVNE